MKALICYAALLILAVAPARAEDFTLPNGKVLKDVRISKVDPDGLRITHAEGMTKVSFEDLPPAVQERYKFDPAQSDAFRQKTQMAREQADEQHKRQIDDMQRTAADAAEKARKTPHLTLAESVKSFWLRSLPMPEGITDHQYPQKVRFCAYMAKVIQSGQLNLDAEKTAMLWNQRELDRVGQYERANEFTAQITKLQEAINKREERRQQAEIAL